MKKYYIKYVIVQIVINYPATLHHETLVPVLLSRLLQYFGPDDKSKAEASESAPVGWCQTLSSSVIAVITPDGGEERSDQI